MTRLLLVAAALALAACAPSTTAPEACARTVVNAATVHVVTVCPADTVKF